MQPFKDSTGHEWAITIDGGLIKQVFAELEVDLGQPSAGDPPLLTRFCTDVIFLVDLLWLACRGQAKELGLTDIEFAGRLQGDTLRTARDALSREWSDFFQSLGREDQVQAIARMVEMVDRGAELVGDQLNQPELLDNELAELGERCAALLPSRESTPSPEPSVS